MKLKMAEPENQFDTWRHYFGLAKLVKAGKLRNETEPIAVAEKTGTKVAERRKDKTRQTFLFTVTASSAMYALQQQ